MIIAFFRTVRAAGWAPLGLIAIYFLSVEGLQLDKHFTNVDDLAHFLGGVSSAYFLSRLFVELRVLPGSLSRAMQTLLLVGLTAMIAIAWECMEFLSDSFLATQLAPGIGDVLLDLILGMTGSAVFMLVWTQAEHKRLLLRPGSNEV